MDEANGRTDNDVKNVYVYLILLIPDRRIYYYRSVVDSLLDILSDFLFGVEVGPRIKEGSYFNLVNLLLSRL